MKEHSKALRAFEDYFGLGDDRSLTRLQDIYLARAKTGDSVPTRQRTRTLSVRLRIPADAARGCMTGHVRFNGDGFSVRRPFELLVTGPLTLSARAVTASRAVVTVTNRSPRSLQGALTCASALWPAGAPISFRVEGMSSTQLPITLRGAVTGSEELCITASSGDVSEPHSLWLHPLLMNGGFERGGTRPGGWAYQSAHLACSSTEDPHEGKACLQLQGEKGVFVEAHRTLPVAAGPTYRAQCWVRRTDGAARKAAPCVVLFLKAGGERYLDLRKLTQNPDDQWNRYEVRFELTEDAKSAALYLYNVDSTATVWYDAASVWELLADD